MCQTPNTIKNNYYPGLSKYYYSKPSDSAWSINSFLTVVGSNYLSQVKKIIAEGREVGNSEEVIKYLGFEITSITLDEFDKLPFQNLNVLTAREIIDENRLDKLLEEQARLYLRNRPKKLERVSNKINGYLISKGHQKLINTSPLLFEFKACYLFKNYKLLIFTWRKPRVPLGYFYDIIEY
jgi:hypothetical protein